MLKITLFELLLRGIPESLLFLLAVYALSKTKFNLIRYLTSCIILCAMVYLVRLLPIQHGADTVLNLITVILLATFLIKIDIVQSIKAGIIIMLLQFLYEGINVFIIEFIMNENLNRIFKNPILKVIYITPSLFAFGITIILYYLFSIKGKELNNISYGEISK